MNFKHPVRVALARQFTRSYWDSGPCRFTKDRLLQVADDDAARLLAELQEFERTGCIEMVGDFHSAKLADSVVRLIALPAMDDNEQLHPYVPLPLGATKS